MTEVFTPEEVRECVHRTTLEAYCHALTASWKWVTADELLEKGPGHISYVILTATGNNCTCTLHDGVDANAKVIAILETTAAQSRPYAFHDHLLFKHGLYLNLSGDVLGILVVWHALPHGIRGR